MYTVVISLNHYKTQFFNAFRQLSNLYEIYAQSVVREYSVLNNNAGDATAVAAARHIDSANRR